VPFIHSVRLGVDRPKWSLVGRDLQQVVTQITAHRKRRISCVGPGIQPYRRLLAKVDNMIVRHRLPHRPGGFLGGQGKGCIFTFFFFFGVGGLGGGGG
jgi:hypothetical protein